MRVGSKPRHVLFGCDDNGFCPLSVAVYSLLRTADADIPLRITVLTGENQLTEEHQAALQGLASGFRFAKLEIINIDVLLAKYESLFATATHSWGALVWARCFIGELFPDDDGNIVYLDIDTLVCRDLADLYELDLSDCGDGRPYVVGAVSETHRETAAVDDSAFAGGWLPSGYDRYFNSGVLVMNARAFREERLAEKIFAWYAQHKTEATCPDQDALNACFYDRIRFLHPRFNYNDGWLARQAHADIRAAHWRGNRPSEILEAILDPAIIHFMGSKKPWRANHRPEGGRYERVMREAGVLTESLPGMSLVKRLERWGYTIYHAVLRGRVRRKCKNER